jgi:CheY-like chemotaxis protein
VKMESIQGKRVLVVEDEVLILSMISNMLTDFGCVVAGSTTRFAEAIDKAGSTECDIAILDINLQGQASYPIGQVLRQRNIPFVFATGYAEKIVEDEFSDVPIVRKPFDTDSLLEALRKLVKHSKSERDLA